MPFRHAAWWLLALFPLIAVAFWPGYWGRLGEAPFALHAHGITATAWLLLLALQSWSIHARTPGWHRAAGLATFVVLPLFAAAGPLALHSMASLWRSEADPFHAAYGAQLVVADAIAGPSVVIMVVYAFLQRRRVLVHASAMLATALLVLPPIIGRLFPLIPGYPTGGEAGFAGFRLSFYLGGGLTLAIALWLALTRRGSGLGFWFAAASTAIQMIGFDTIGQTTGWERFVVMLTRLPVAPLALLGGVGAALLLWWAWRKVPSRTAPYARVDLADEGRMATS